MIEECLVVEFAVEGDDCPLASATRATGTTVEAHPPQLREDGNALIRASTPVGSDVVEALEADDRVRYLHVARSGDRSNVRFLSKRPCVVHDLASEGFLAESLTYRDGVGRFRGAVVGLDVLQGVLGRAGETVGVRLEHVHPLGADEDEAVAPRWNLTGPQAEALRTAFEMGYFAVPRETTATAVADRIGISKSAYLERLHRGQSRLLGRVF